MGRSDDCTRIERLRRSLRYHLSHVSRSPRFLFSRSAMISMWRILVALSLALLFTQGAFAHSGQVSTGGMVHASHQVSRAPSSCPDAVGTGSLCHHDHSICCTTACGVHCGAFFTAFHFETRASGGSLPLPVSEPPRDSVAHAPLLRPPIV